MDTKTLGIIGGLALVLALLSPFVFGSTRKVKQAFKDAEALYEQRQYEAASEKYNNTLKSSKKFGVKTDSIAPDFRAHIHYKMAQCAKQLGRGNVALQHYREVIVNFPESRYVTDSYVGSGDIYFDRKEYRAASEEYKRALETTADEERKKQIGQKYQQTLILINGPGPKTIPEPPVVEEIDTLDFSLLTEAAELRFNERFEEAAMQYQVFANAYLPLEDAIYALYWTGRCYHEARLFQQSADTFKRFTANYGYSSNAIEAYHGLAAVYLDWAKRDEDTSKCRLAIQTVEDTERKYPASRTALERTVLDLMQKIKREAEDCMPPEPPPEEEYVRQGHQHFEKGELEIAETKAKKALRINPTYPPAEHLLTDIARKYYNNGLDLLDANRSEDAIIKFNKVVSIDPDHKEAYLHLGVAHFNLHNYNYAANAANEALAIDSEYEEARRLWEAIETLQENQ